MFKLFRFDSIQFCKRQCLATYEHFGSGQTRFIHHGGLFIKPKDSDLPQVTATDVLTTYASAYEVGPEYNPSKFEKILKKFQHEYAHQYPSDQATLPFRTMSDSFQSVLFNFDDFEQGKIGDNTNNVVVVPESESKKKLLLSFCDVFAVWLSYQHLHVPAFEGRPHPYIMISAFLDHMSFTDCPIQPRKIVRLSSHVTRATESTLEVVIECHQPDDDDDDDTATGKWRVVAESVFLLAARAPRSDGLKKAIVNKLVAQTEQEDQYLRLINQIAKERELFLRQMVSANGNGQTPSGDELNLLQKLRKGRNDPLAVSMQDTKIEASQFCGMENRNRYYTTYGGFLITSAEEAAFIAAKLFRSQPKLLHVAHGSFLQTVPIGCELRAQAVVSSTADNLIHISVTSRYSTGGQNGESKVANIFQFVYAIPHGTKLPSIVLKDDQEKFTYIMGRRFLNYIHGHNISMQ